MLDGLCRAISEKALYVIISMCNVSYVNHQLVNSMKYIKPSIDSRFVLCVLTYLFDGIFIFIQL